MEATHDPAAPVRPDRVRHVRAVWRGVRRGRCVGWGMTRSPVYDGFATPPPTYPLGMPIADRVTIKDIDERTATRMYEAHHSYMPHTRSGTHHGVYLDGEIVGSITYSPWPSQSKIRGRESKSIREVGRVCVANDTPNLASCAMSKSQDKYVDERGDEFELLVTYVRADYEGSMFAALKGKGWERDGISPARTPSEHDSHTHDVVTYDKERWVCEV